MRSGPCGATKGGSLKKRSLKAVQRKASKRDLQVEEFDKRDLGQDIRAAGRLRLIRKNLPTSIVLEPDLIDKLRKKAAKRGLGYQTMLKVIVREHVDEY